MTRVFGRVSMAIAVLAIVALCAPFADAQGGGGRGGRGGGGFGGQGRGGGRGLGGASYVSVASNTDVQALIKATDEQKEKITAVNEKLTTDRGELFQNPGENMLADMAKLNNDAGAKVAEALDSAQNKSVLSLLVQASGGPALRDAQLQKYLKVTEEQKTKLGEIQPMRGGGGGRRGQQDQTPEEIAAARVERDKPYTDILTADQKTAWAELEKAQKADEELVTQLSRGGFGRGGGRGGRGGRGGGGAGGGAGGGN